MDRITCVILQGGANILTEYETQQGPSYERAYQYDNKNQIVEFDDKNTHFSYTYDPVGNRIAKIENGGQIHSYEYDSEDRLVQHRDHQNKKYTNKYDALGTKITEGRGQPNANPTETVKYINDLNNISSQYSQILTTKVGGKYKASYVYGNLRLSETDLQDPIKDNKNPLYYLNDGRTSVSMMVNLRGQQHDKYRYDPYGLELSSGKLTPNIPNLNNIFGYNGEHLNIDTGLINLRARHYDSTVGRFISRDTLRGGISDPLSLNRYAYCENNPVMYADPSGMWLTTKGMYSDAAYVENAEGIEYGNATIELLKQQNRFPVKAQPSTSDTQNQGLTTFNIDSLPSLTQADVPVTRQTKNSWAAPKVDSPAEQRAKQISTSEGLAKIKEQLVKLKTKFCEVQENVAAHKMDEYYQYYMIDHPPGTLQPPFDELFEKLQPPTYYVDENGEIQKIELGIIDIGGLGKLGKLGVPKKTASVSSGSGKVPSASTKTVNVPEVKAPNAMKASNVTQSWDDFLGSNQTNINPLTGKADTNRIFSTDGTRSIRFGNHEMGSMGTPKGHFHYETWTYDAATDTMTITNLMQRIIP